jgi:hypothetical protein
LTALDPDVLVELVEQGFLRLAYEADRLGMITEGSGSPVERHDAIYLSAPKHQLDVALPEILVEVTGQAGRGRRLARRLESRVDQVHYTDFDTEAARRELLDLSYVRDSVRILLDQLVPEYNGGTEFTVSTQYKMLKVDSDIDFEKANWT